MAKATFGAGCFWGVEVAFREVPGVIDATVGYMGGLTREPTYEQVCTDRTGHAEVVHVEFDPSTVSFETLLDRFFMIHDPTQLNRQGPDYGSQYRSAVFFHDEQQREAAEKSKAAWQARSARPIVTQITEAGEFWPAEEYHQRYLERRGMASCHVSTDWLAAR